MFRQPEDLTLVLVDELGEGACVATLGPFYQVRFLKRNGLRGRLAHDGPVFSLFDFSAEAGSAAATARRDESEACVTLKIQPL
jgi:hypothetical protein